MHVVPSEGGKPYALAAKSARSLFQGLAATTNTERVNTNHKKFS